MTFVVLSLAFASLSSASEIPPRPEDLTFPALSFSVPDRDSLRFDLANGTPVYAKQDSQFPLVSLSLLFRGGTYLEPAGKEGLASLTAQAWRTGGAGERDAQQLDEELEFLAATLSTNLGGVTGSVSLNILSKDLDTGLALLMDVLTRPRFQQDRFAKAREDLIQQMKQRNDSTAAIEAREFSRLVYGDEYWLNRLPTKASVDAITVEDCKRFVESLIRCDNLAVAVSGDFERDALLAKLEATIGTLPKLSSPLPEVPQPKHQATPGLYVVNKPDVNQGRVSIGELGTSSGDPLEHSLLIMNDILGGGDFTSRMMKRVRSDEGLAYSAYSSYTMPLSYPGTLRAFFQSKSSTCPFAIKLTLDIINEMRSTPVSMEELATSKASFVETFPRYFESPGKVVELFAVDELLGRPADYWTTYRDKINAVTAEDVLAAAQQRLDPDKLVILVVGDIEKVKQGHPDHDVSITDFGKLRELKLRDPLTLE